MTAIPAYLSEVRKLWAAGNATEHSYRPAVHDLFKALDFKALNEPKRVECGAPDFLIHNGHKNHIGHVECKDIDVVLDREIKSKQMVSYLGALPNLLFTNHLEWRWYAEGKHKETVVLGTVGKDGKIIQNAGQQEALQALLGRFASCSMAVPTTPKELAKNLALKAKLARENIEKALGQQDSTFRGLLTLFQKALKPGMGDEEFADVLAQTLTYGLFAQWAEGGSVPKSMPFLRTFLKHILRSSDDDEEVNLTGVKWVVEGIVDLLGRTNRKVLEGFGGETGMVDPIIHFYEDFLNEYDPVARKTKGVWYTPAPVVNYIVNQVDLKLREDLGKPLGLADPSVHILDPACGTGTFLLAVIRKIHATLVEEGWEPKEIAGQIGGILDRLYGLELMMAPYAIAHLAIFRLLRNLKVEVPEGSRMRVYLADTLIGPNDNLEEALKLNLESSGAGSVERAMADEAKGAQEIKAAKPVMVVLGNPPYNGESQNRGQWITDLMCQYKLVGERNAKWLQDDYVKFWRFASDIISRNGDKGGIVGFISPHGWLDGPTFRGMREHMLGVFNQVNVIDLHGNTNKKEQTPTNLVASVGVDENVFQIRQGVGITIAVHAPNKPKQVQWAELWGQREEKFKMLQAGVTLMEMTPKAPIYILVPTEEAGAEYTAGWSVKGVFPLNGVGMTSARDHVAYASTPGELLKRAAIFTDKSLTTKQACNQIEMPDKIGYDADKARESLASVDPNGCVRRVNTRLFDPQFVLYHKSFVWCLCRGVMEHLKGDSSFTNVALLCCHQQSSNEGFYHVSVTAHAVSDTCLSARSRECGSAFPLYLLPQKSEEDDNDILSFVTMPSKPTPNLSPDFIQAFTASTCLTFDPADPKTAGDNFETKWTPLDLLHYIYGLLHDHTYRTKYAEFLKRDFPRILLPTPDTLPRARTLRAMGEALVALHLPDRWDSHPNLHRKVLPISYLQGDGPNVMEKLVYKDNRVYINPTQYFDGVTDEMWEARIGGYQPAQKWLKDRKGRVLTSDDILHYRRVCQVLAETARLMRELLQAEVQVEEP